MIKDPSMTLRKLVAYLTSVAALALIGCGGGSSNYLVPADTPLMKYEPPAEVAQGEDEDPDVDPEPAPAEDDDDDTGSADKVPDVGDADDS